MKWSRYPAIMAILVLGMAAYAPGARAITPITQCTTITQPGSYIVVQNLVAAGDCLVVAADFVSIHLAGSLLIGNGTGTGIRDSGLRKGITIHDGTITHFLAGLRFCGQGSIQILVERMRVIDNTNDGIALCDGMAIVKDTISSGNSQGIFAGPRSVVTGNTASNNQLLGIQFGEGSTVTGNTADNNGNTGLSGGAGAGSTIVNNTMRSNTLFGLLVACPSNLIENTATNNGTNFLLLGAGCNSSNNVAP